MLLTLLALLPTVLALRRSTVQHICLNDYSSDACCDTAHSNESAGHSMTVDSIDAHRKIWEPFSIYYSCFDPRATTDAVFTDPDNKIPSMGDGRETIVSKGHKLQCSEEFHTVFILKVLLRGRIFSKGYCMFWSPAVEARFVQPIRQNHRLAQFQALTQPVDEDVYGDITIYHAFVLSFMSELNREQEQHNSDAKKAHVRALRLAQAESAESMAGPSAPGGSAVATLSWRVQPES